ncbi:MAG: hypothetical protein ACRYFX_20340 [Janthinobacterium lividum]
MAKNYLSPDDSRRVFALTQQRLAEWLGVSTSAVALLETNRRGLPGGVAASIQLVRLALARRGEVPSPPGEGPPAVPGPPPLPLPSPNAEPLRRRLDECRHRATNLRYELAQLQARAACHQARLVALPALRAYAGPVPHPAQEKSWLDLFESEALAALCDDCGAGPQALLAARLAGLEREAELLEALLAAPPVLAPAQGAA